MSNSFFPARAFRKLYLPIVIIKESTTSFASASGENGTAK